MNIFRITRYTLAYVLATHVIAGHAAPPAPASVIVAEVQRKGFANELEALGTLTANESVNLTVNVTETVSAVHFDDGDRVKSGAVLVEMTSREEHAQLEEARATVNEARRQYERIRSLEAKGTAAKSLLDERQREWETARARLNAIESRLTDRLVKAPFDGVLGLRDLSVGALVQPGDRVTTIDDDSVMKVDFQVPGTRLGMLQTGLDIIATSNAFPDRRFEGTVKSIDSRIDPVTRSIRVRALLPNPDRLLKPGMLMQVVLLYNPREALVIPEEALQPLGTRHYVYIVDEGNENKVVKREIKIAGRRPGEVEVLDGLSVGEKVITHGNIKLRPGQPVDIRVIDDGSQSLADMLRSLRDGNKTE